MTPRTPPGFHRLIDAAHKRGQFVSGHSYLQERWAWCAPMTRVLGDIFDERHAQLLDDEDQALAEYVLADKQETD